MRLGLSVPIASHCTRRQAFRVSVTSAYPKADFYRVRFGLRPSITLPQNGTGSNGAQQTTEERMQKDNHNTHTHRHRRKGHIWAPDSMQPDNNKKRIFSFFQFPFRLFPSLAQQSSRDSTNQQLDHRQCRSPFRPGSPPGRNFGVWSGSLSVSRTATAQQPHIRTQLHVRTEFNNSPWVRDLSRNKIIPQ